MVKLNIITEKDDPFPTIKINNNIIPVFDFKIEWNVNELATIELSSYISDSSEIDIETDKFILNGFPVDDEVGKKIFVSLLKKYFSESIISNWVDNEDRISDQEAMEAIELFYKFLLGEK